MEKALNIFLGILFIVCMIFGSRWFGHALYEGFKADRDKHNEIRSRERLRDSLKIEYLKLQLKEK